MLEGKEALELIKQLSRILQGILILFVFLSASFAYLFFFYEEFALVEQATENEPGPPVAATALLSDAPGKNLVAQHCTTCHSAHLIVQNRLNRKRWEEVIRLMQREHNLWDLGEAESEILDYLEANYAPEAFGRRKNLDNIEWYEL